MTRFLYCLVVLLAAYAIWQGLIYRDVYHHFDRDAGSQAMGAAPDQAKVTIIAFVDYPTIQSREMNPVVLQALHDHPDLRVIFHPLPQNSELSQRAARLALAAAKQGKYDVIHNELMRNRRPVTDDLVREMAERQALDADQWLADSESDEIKKTAFKTLVLSRKLKVYGTPAFVFNRRAIFIPDGAYPTIVEFTDMINRARTF